MSVLGFFVGIGLALGLFLAFLGVAMLSLTLTAPLAYRANMLDVQYWTLDTLGFLPWVRETNEYASAATFTIVFLVIALCIGALGVFLLWLPRLVLV